jgi:hypothetical protein
MKGGTYVPQDIRRHWIPKPRNSKGTQPILFGTFIAMGYVFTGWPETLQGLRLKSQR